MTPRDKRWIVSAIALCVGLIYIYPLFLPTPLLDPDEGLHAAISQQMVEEGDYIIPRYLGEPFRDKPILFFAAQALSLRMFGMQEGAVRLPGLMFALLGVLATGLLAWRLYDATTAAITILVSLTLAIPLSLAQFAVHDVAAVPWTTLLLLCLWEMERPPANPGRRRAWYGVGAAVLVALAILTKGLLGIAILSVGYTLYLVLARALTWSLVIRHGLILGGGALLASPWFLAMEWASPGYLYYYFIERHFLGYATVSQHHGGEPWYYYLPILLFGAMPWTPYALAWIANGRWRRSGHKSLETKADLLLACCFCGGLLFLSLAGSKLLTYALPLFPLIAIAAGVTIKQFQAATLAPAIQRAIGWNFRLLSALGCVTPMAALVVLHRAAHMPTPRAAWWVAWLAASMTAAGFYLFQRGRIWPAFSCGTVWVALMFVMLTTWPLQALAKEHTQYELARRVNQLADRVDRLVLVDELPASVIFYLRPELRNRLRRGGIATMSRSAVDSAGHLLPGSLLAVSGPMELGADPRKSLPAVCSNERVGRYQLFREISPSHEFSLSHRARQPEGDAIR